MEHHNHQDRGGEGRLPAMAPLANPYVPFQLENPPKYEPPKAWIRGTLYPGLDLPFMGMANTREFPENPSSRLQILAFALQELTLYMDTHREDTEALELYRHYQSLYHEALMEYNKNCRPVTHILPAEGSYRWLDDPWPWEYCNNCREGK
ncbi:MAG TPA: spore coat protein CotJB [Candidatus Faecousia intestinigallinarum]|nr:spore coat protein CotJB [Candidatus Faecousia intestinigallinarum]